MRKVIDSNYLQSPKLRDYLSASNDNLAVFTDYVAMEAYKGDTLKSIYPSMEIISEFPRQILVLKSTSKIVGLSGREKGLQRRMIDQHQTAGFPKFCADLLAANAGNRALEKSLIRMGKVASKHLEKVMSDAERLPEALNELIKMFTQHELDEIRKGAPFAPGLADKTIKSAMTMAAVMGADHPEWRSLPRLDELPNTFLFRFTLSALVFMVHRIELGGFGGAKPERLRNDVVDLSFAAYATYFDGLLTGDSKLVSIYDFTAALLVYFKRRLANDDC